MKKIAFLIRSFPQKYDTFVINQIINAHNAGYEIRIFPQTFGDLKDASQSELIEIHGLMDKVVKPIPFDFSKRRRIKWLLNTLRRGPKELILYFIKSLNPSLFGRRGINLFMFHRVMQFYGSFDFDIFHCQFGPNGFHAAWLKELGILKGKIITTFHGYDAHFNDKYLKKIYYSKTRSWSPLLFNNSDLVTANSPYLREQLILLGAEPDRIELFPMGVDTSFFLPKKNSDRKDKIQLLSVGRLSKLKGHELGIQAAANLIREGLNIDYFIVGNGYEQDHLQISIEKLHLERHVKLLGAKNQSEIRKVMQESDVFLMTSVYDKYGRRETQGVVTAEAQACGLPVVAFRSGGVPYTLEEGSTGFLAEEKNVSEFTQHLRNLCTNETLRHKMGQNARNFIKDNFCQTKLAQKQISLYEKVLSN